MIGICILVSVLTIHFLVVNSTVGNIFGKNTKPRCFWSHVKQSVFQKLFSVYVTSAHPSTAHSRAGYQSVSKEIFKLVLSRRPGKSSSSNPILSEANHLKLILVLAPKRSWVTNGTKPNRLSKINCLCQCSLTNAPQDFSKVMRFETWLQSPFGHRQYHSIPGENFSPRVKE